MGAHPSLVCGLDKAFVINRVGGPTFRHLRHDQSPGHDRAKEHLPVFHRDVLEG